MSTYTLQAVKGPKGEQFEGHEVTLAGLPDQFEPDMIYDTNLNPVIGSPLTCTSPACDEPAMELARDQSGLIRRVCQEHAADYRRLAHEAGLHDPPDERWDRNCPECDPTGLSRDPSA